MSHSEVKPHQERAFYKVLYTARSFAFFDWLYHLLGRRAFNAIAGFTGWIYAVSQPGVRRIVADNLQLLTGSPANEEEAASVFRNFGLTISDYLASGNITPAEARSWMEPNIGAIEAAFENGKGAILATGHFGFFEFGANLLGQRNIPVSVLTLSEPTRALTEWRATFRARWGAKTIEVGREKFASLEIVHALNAGEICAMLVDRPYENDHTIPIDLPGGQILFSTSAALLARLADCPIIPVAVTRLPGGKYRLTAKPPIFVEKDKPRKEALETATRALARELFEEIQKAPTQWYQFVSVRH